MPGKHLMATLEEKALLEMRRPMSDLKSRVEWKSYLPLAGSASRFFGVKTEVKTASHCFKIVSSP